LPQQLPVVLTARQVAVKPAGHDLAPVLCRGAIMSAAFEKLRTIRVRIAVLRAAGIDD
jgi:hypothetical protein